MQMKAVLSIILVVVLLIGVVVMIVNKPPEAIEFRFGCVFSSACLFEVKRDGTLYVSTGYSGRKEQFSLEPFLAIVNNTGQVKLSSNQIDKLNSLVLEASKYEERNYWMGALREDDGSYKLDKDGKIIQVSSDTIDFYFYIQGKRYGLDVPYDNNLDMYNPLMDIARMIIPLSPISVDPVFVRVMANHEP